MIYQDYERLHDAVCAGTALLDQQSPGWRSKIDVTRLNMAWEASCILGQLYGDYEDGLYTLELRHREASLYGFLVDRVNCLTPYRVLTRMWIMELDPQYLAPVPA